MSSAAHRHDTEESTARKLLREQEASSAAYTGEPHAWRAHLACGHANDLRPSWNGVVESNQGPYEGYCRLHDKFFKIVRFERYDPSPLRESEEQYAPEVALPGRCAVSESAASSQVERDVVTVRSAIDYPDRNSYIKALEALDRLAAKAHEADALIAQHELCGGAE